MRGVANTRRPAAAVLALLVAMVTACSSGGEAREPTVSAPTPELGAIPTARPVDRTATAEVATAAPSPTATSERVPPRGVLRMAVSQPPSHLDVHQESSPALMTWGPGIAYDRLFRFDADAEEGGSYGAVVCLLCESWEMVDATTYRVTLRPDALWQDLPPVGGRAVLANDVVFSLRRQATNGWPNAGLLANVERIAALDARTVQFVLGRPDAEFLEILADSRSVIVAPEAVGDGDLIDGPVVGSGPWVWAGTTESQTVMTANPDYFDAARPGVETLEIAYLSPGTQFSSLLTGVIDFARLEPAEYAVAVERNPDLLVVDVPQSGSGLELAINTERGQMSDIDVRRSLLGELRPWDALGGIWGGHAAVGVGLPMTNPRWMPGENEVRSIFDEFAASPRVALDPGSPIVIKVGLSDERFVEHAHTAADAIVRLGGAATIEEVTTRDFANEVWFGGDYDVFLGAQPPVASLSDFLLSVYHSRGAWNTTGYSSGVLDTLIENQAVESDVLVRQGLVVEIQREILAGAHRFAPAARVDRWLAWPAVQGFFPATPRGDGGFLSEIRLDETRSGRR